MHVDLSETLEELQLALRAVSGAREPQDAFT
jgi:hypothetical protein